MCNYEFLYTRYDYFHLCKLYFIYIEIFYTIHILYMIIVKQIIYTCVYLFIYVRIETSFFIANVSMIFI